jgi:hypothetical protein
MNEAASNSEESQREVRFISKKSPDYRLEFINGAFSNVTQRGEIVCDFHVESRDMPTEQVAILIDTVNQKGTLSPLKDPGTFTRDTKFGIIINVSFAKDFIQMLEGKIKEAEERIASREADRANLEKEAKA